MGKRLTPGGRMRLTVSRHTGDILDGIVDLSEWDDEEILRGQRRGPNGRFMGKAPIVVPQAVHAERIKRTMSKAFDLLKVSTYDAVRLLRSVVNDPEASYEVRVRASELILDRVLGKPSGSLAVSFEVDPPWMVALRDAIVIGESEDTIADYHPGRDLLAIEATSTVLNDFTFTD